MEVRWQVDPQGQWEVEAILIFAFELLLYIFYNY